MVPLSLQDIDKCVCHLCLAQDPSQWGIAVNILESSPAPKLMCPLCSKPTGIFRHQMTCPYDKGLPILLPHLQPCSSSFLSQLLLLLPNELSYHLLQEVLSNLPPPTLNRMLLSALSWGSPRPSTFLSLDWALWVLAPSLTKANKITERGPNT